MAKETDADSSVPLAEIAAALGLLVALGQKLLSRVDAIAKLSGVELPSDAPPAVAEAATDVEPTIEDDASYAHSVAVNHLGERAIEVLQKLNDEQLSQLVAAGREGDLDTVKVLLGLATA